VTDISENAHRVAVHVLTAHGDRLAIGRTAYRFAVIQKAVKPSPVDLAEDTRMAKREASRITNFPNELIERFARMSAIGP